jgi:hypothetical protein
MRTKPRIGVLRERRLLIVSVMSCHVIQCFDPVMKFPSSSETIPAMLTILLQDDIRDRSLTYLTIAAARLWVRKKWDRLKGEKGVVCIERVYVILVVVKESLTTVSNGNWSRELKGEY